MKKLDFRIRVEVDSESGKPLAVYLQIRKGKAARVQELVQGGVFVDFAGHRKCLVGRGDPGPRVACHL